MLAVEKAIPILRIFDEAKAREFYCDWLGFAVDWEHRFEPGTPLYAQISLGNLALHLSEHHGDGTPGSYVFVRVNGLRAWHQQLRPYKYLRPGIEQPSWGGISVTLVDPFRNQLLLWEEEGADFSPEELAELDRRFEEMETNETMSLTPEEFKERITHATPKPKN